MPEDLKKPPKGVQEVVTVDSIMASIPHGQQCGRCGIINSESEKHCAWCEAELGSTVNPAPAPQRRRVGPKPSK